MTTTTTRTQQQSKPIEKEIDPNAPLLDEVIAKTIDKLDTFTEKYAREIDDPNVTAFRRASMMAMAIKRLRGLITEPVIVMLRELMNTPLGFKTDRGPHNKRNPAPYPDDVIRDCAIEALLRGVMWTGNEFNIIAGQCYVTKEGYTRKIQETKGLTNLVLSPGIPRVDKETGRTVVRFGASWTFNGIDDCLRDAEGKPGRVIPIVINEGSGPDQIIGKAHRKGLKAVYDQIHGSSHEEREDTDIIDEIADPSGDQCRNVITDSQAATLTAIMQEHRADPELVRRHFGLQPGQKILAMEYEICVRMVKEKRFTPRQASSLAEGELPPDEMAEILADEYEQAGA